MTTSTIPAATRDPAGLDLADPRLHAETDLHGVWAHLRSEQPVYWQPPVGDGDGFWNVTRYEDVDRLYKDDRRLTSERGNVLDALMGRGDSAGGRMVSVTDGVRHAEVRKILLRSFTREALTAAGTRIRSAARRLVREAVSRGRCDFARDVAAHVPLVAICDLLGVPEADRPHILGLTSSAVSSEQAQHTAQDAWRAKNDILFYFAELAERRRDDPLADLVSVLVTSRVNGRPLDLDEVIFNCYSLVLGGDETTRLAIVGGVLALIEHPGQWRALREGEVDIDTAVEEVLRWTTPSMHQGRAAVEELTIGGATIRPGELVVLWNVSANRDERVFDRPGRFELTRSPNRHLTFAVGPHYCLGAQLARIEIAAVLEALRDFAGEIEPAGPPTRIYSNFLSGLSSLPVLLRPR